MLPGGERVADESGELRIFKPSNAAVALGLAVSHLMVKPAFANLKFGDWSRILVGQINRGHYCFAVDANNQIQGFMGWALANREHAEGWVEGRRALSFEDSKSGDCMVINAWAASSTKVTRFLLAEVRRVARDKATVYFKRHYKDGSTRPVRVAVNEFVPSHIERSDQPAQGAASGPG
jgi:hemolysin-activating ACP:hemolysin acyltransferase